MRHGANVSSFFRAAACLVGLRRSLARNHKGEVVERDLSMGVDAGMGEQDWSSFHELARKKAGLA